jgi:microcystin-dependent protein
MDPYIGQISLFAGNFAPQGYAFCHGQVLAIAGNEALFSLIGTAYGGDGVQNFALPDLRGRVPVGVGTGPGLSPWVPGEKQGLESVTLSSAQMPAHTHPLQGSTDASNSNDPTNAVLGTDTDNSFVPTSTAPKAMAPVAVTGIGGGQPHQNLAPSLALNYIIALDGVFPARN